MKTARVRTVGKVPRLEIDGKPCRARLFWGGASSVPVPMTLTASAERRASPVSPAVIAYHRYLSESMQEALAAVLWLRL